jgi:glutathione S-transferase
MRARMAIAISGAQVEHREIILRNKPAEMLVASPKGTVLVLSDGRVVDESLDVMRWALALNDPEGWLVSADDPLIAANDGPFKQALDRYKYPHRYDLPDEIAQREAAMEHLRVLDERLAAAPYLSGSQRGFCDIALFPFVRQFANTDRDWFDPLPLPSLQRWLAQMLASPLFELIMVKHPLWASASAAT